MKEPVIYLWSHGRRPVRARSVTALVDRQAQLPAGWCSLCGAEVYRPGHRLCGRCRGKGGTERSIYVLWESL